ncbi:XdhC family protein [Enterobacter sp. MF024]|uniref:XdhC family protein n=1 Tax=Enterobacter sp. MF024 TaxID=2555644 RepID=UPI001106ED11|nr:XdhC family protein [Enterobacter sp. MF024]TLU65033.1 XdhC family protein [Enterobacter sp. MF024]
MLQHAALTEQIIPEQAFATDDSVAVLRFAAEGLNAGMAVALVTLVEIRGGAARPLGAQMAVREDGLYCGYVSGGCVESAAAYEALETLASGKDRQVKYGEGSPWFDIVLPCGGGITLNIHKLRSVQPLLAVLNSLAQRKPVGLRYHAPSQSLHSVPGTPRTGWKDDLFEQGYRPSVRILIYGGSVEAQATARVAQAAGYEVQCNPRRVEPMDADTAVILLWHDGHKELPVLEAALTAEPFYIGALGSRRTHQRRVEKLLELGWEEADIARIKAPIGIFPQARDANTLALSVVADVAAARLHQEEPIKIKGLG